MYIGYNKKLEDGEVALKGCWMKKADFLSAKALMY